MGFLARLPTAVHPQALVGRGAGSGEDFWYSAGGWASSIAMTGGVGISPELAMTLSYVQCAVQTISDDFGSMTCQLFADIGEDAHRRVRYTDPGIGGLAYRLRWQPNRWQSAKAFWSTMAWQYLLRPACYAEILYRPGSDSIIDQLIPRHPDRIEQQVLPNGAMRFKVREPGGRWRYVTEAEMYVVRNTSTDGLNAVSRVGDGATSIATGLSLQAFTRNYFKAGATASLLATYKGASMDEEQEKDLHTSISRYVSGVENAGGLLLVPEDIDVKSLGVDPEKAQLLGLKDLSGRDIARMFKMPPHKLGIAGTQTYASQVQSAQEYAAGTQLPIAIEQEQAIYIHLINARDYFAKFNMDMLVRADLLTRMQAYEIAIRSRIMRPSDARVKEDMSPDPALDRLSESDYRPGTSQSGPPPLDSQKTAGASGLKGTLAMHDNAVRCLRRERAAVEKLAKKYAGDAEGWQAGLQAFYAEHAGFVSQVMRVTPDVARAYAAQHGAAFAAQGMRQIEGEAGHAWERSEADALTALALEGESAAVASPSPSTRITFTREQNGTLTGATIVASDGGTKIFQFDRGVDGGVVGATVEAARP